MSAKKSKHSPVSLSQAGIFGYEAIESVILASLVMADPLLLLDSCGTGKTLLLNSLSEALGLEHRHYNASLISFDDLVGFPSLRVKVHGSSTANTGDRLGSGVGAY